MPRHISLLLSFIAPALIALFLGQLLSVVPFAPVAILIGAVAAVITFNKPSNGLLIIVFAMLLSPEIKLASLPGRSIVVRIEDIIIVMVALAWLAHIAMDKSWKGFVKTPIDLPLAALISVYMVSTGWGILSGSIQPIKASFYLIKYIEYFILFWLTANITIDSGDVKKFIFAALITCLITALYAYSLFPSVERVSAPFDSDAKNIAGESASLAGYLLIIMAVILGYVVSISEPRKIIWLLLFFGFLVPPFIRTLSRASFYAFVPMILVITFFSKRKKIAIISVLALAAILFPLIAPGLHNKMASRLSETFYGTGSTYSLGSYNINLETSASLRIESFKKLFNEWLPSSPIIGRGITGVGLADVQYVLILGELGIGGFIIFLWLIGSIFKGAYRSFKSCNTPIHKGLSLGLIAALSGLIIQSFAVNTFVIIRIMEPFWFLTAIVMRLPELENNGQNTAQHII